MDQELRNSLWNISYTYILYDLEREIRTDHFQENHAFFVRLWDDHFKKPIDTIPTNQDSVVKEIRKYFFSCDWHQVYNLIEHLVKYYEFEEPEYKNEAIESFNGALEREMSAFRFINGVLSPIVSPSEIESIEQAIQNSNALGFSGVKEHLDNAIAKLSDKISPDYRNSIKEAISAIESLCKVLTDDSSATLGSTLKKLKDSIEMHPAFEEALRKLYGYTSDADGIRHGCMDKPNLDQEDAVFMLVTCSAFINYLIVKSDKAGLLTGAIQ